MGLEKINDKFDLNDKIWAVFKFLNNSQLINGEG